MTTNHEQGFLDILIEILPFIGVSTICGLYAASRRGVDTLKDFILSICGSAICGGIVGWGMMSISQNAYAIGAVCGIAGLLGDKGLQMLQKKFYKAVDQVIPDSLTKK